MGEAGGRGKRARQEGEARGEAEARQEGEARGRGKRARQERADGAKLVVYITITRAVCTSSQVMHQVMHQVMRHRHFAPLLFVVLLASTSAHVPVFPPATSASDPYVLPTVTKKSYGVYGEVGPTDVIWLEMEGVKGEEMTVSLQRNEKRAVYDVAIWGEGLANVTCGGKNWYGWAHSIGGHFFTRNLTELPASVREAIASSGKDAFVLHGDGLEESEFEPFGVGLYWPLGGCKSSFPESSTYSMAIVNPKEVVASFSLGVGMVESFTLADLLLMSFPIYRTMVWGGRSAEGVLAIFALSLVLYYGFKLLTVGQASYSLVGGGTRASVFTVTLHLIWICGGAFFANGISFLIQLILCATIKPDLGSVVLLPLMVHTALPILFSLLIFFLYQPYGAWWIKVGALAAGLYMLFFGWLSFVVFPVVFLVAVTFHFF